MTEKIKGFQRPGAESRSKNTEFRMVDEEDDHIDPKPLSTRTNTHETFGRVPAILASGDWDLEELTTVSLYKKPSLFSRFINYFYA